MALGDILQDPTPTASAGNVATFGSPAFGVAPTVGDTDIIAAVSSSTINTPAGYSRDIFDASNAGIYLFRKTVQVGDTGGAVTLTIVSTRPVVIFRYEISGTASLEGTPTANPYNGVTTTTRLGTAVTTSVTTGLIVVGTDADTTLRTWNTWNNSLVEVDQSIPGGGTQPFNGLVAYANGVGAATITPQATSPISKTKYQVLTAAYSFAPTTPAAATPNATQGLPLYAAQRGSSW